MTKIIAAVTTRVVLERDYHEIRDSISHDLLNFLHYQNIIPVLLPNHPALALELVDYTDILILSGGNNLITNSDYRRIKEDDFSNAIHTRNNIEMKLIEEYRNSSKPIFGICHGLQIINHFFGGTLRRVKLKNKHVANEHQIKAIGANSKRWFGANKLLVNSYHNYAVDKLGKNLEIMALSNDGEIESVSHKNEKIMAIMWHPERNFSDVKSGNLNRNIINRYIDTVK